ncbi:MAG: hypothetical protein WB460_10910 [Candidatus Acidiferrales bacterium]
MPNLQALNRALCIFMAAFTVMVLGAPRAEGQTGPVSDDFHSATLNTGLWSVVNPLNDGSVGTNGIDAVLSVPAGTEHDLWTGGNHAVRMMQAAADGDFQVEVKFDSIATTADQDQGLIVQTDANNYLRFDLVADGTRQRMFAASFVNNSPTVQSDIAISGAKAPFWIRVKRTGNTWTDSWSVDGNTFNTATTFDYALTVNQVGPFAGNCCSSWSPAFTAYVDYFFNSASPISPADGGMWLGASAPVVSGISATSVTSAGAAIAWTTDQFANSRVDYGTTGTYGAFVSDSGLALNHSTALTGLSCNTQYHYEVSSTNTGGYTGSSTDNTFTTGTCQTVSGPVISGISATGVTSAGAAIAWTTDQPSNSRVDYGTTSSYGAFVSDPGLVLSHLIALAGLSCNTQYHYEVSSTNTGGYTGSSTDNMFKTGACQTVSGPTSDDFNAASLNTGLWTVVNPLGDGTVSTNGSEVVLSIPAGTEHDPWTGGNHSVQILQPTANSDFQVEVKFDSIPTMGNQDQGILVQTDARNYLRFDVYSDGTSQHMFAASFVNDNPTVYSNLTIGGAKAPFWIRLTRTGNSWTDSWSVDGTNFTTAATFGYATTANQIGLFVGNCCGTGSPAFTAKADYFLNGTTTAPSLTSDEFNSTSLNGTLWTIVNSIGDGTVRLDGTDALLTVPAGTPHDPWTQGNQSLRILQSIANTDFQVEVKFDSIPTVGNQDQGILVQTDAHNYLRFDVYSDGTSQHMFAASFVNDNPTVYSNLTISGAKAPSWIRLTRTGNSWTDSWSVDGTNFTTAATFNYAMTANQIGLFSGNCCGSTAPAFTASVDYFHDRATQISVGVSPNTVSVSTGAPQVFSAVVANDGSNEGVGWTLSGTGCSGTSCGALSNVTATGATYTAPVSVPSPATVALEATSVADPTKFATASITITTPSGVTLSPTSANVATGSTQSFTASVPNDSTNEGVSWSLFGSGCSGASCGTLSNATTTGVTYTAPSSVPSPPAVALKATSVADATKFASATITVLPMTLSVSPVHGAATVTQRLTFTATTNDTAGVTWSVSPSGGSFNPQTSLSGAGVTFTAPSSAGVYTVTATSVTDVTRSVSVTVGVTDLNGVFTYHNNGARTGVNSQEYALTPSNVNTSSFAKLFSCPADGAIYGQPLWVANVAIGGGTHNVIVAATARDSVYVFDADASPCVTYWHKTLIPSGETYGSYADVGSLDIYPDIGIVATPVIDPSTDKIYVVSKTKTSAAGVYHQRLHALNLSDGSEPVSAVDLTSSITVPGTGDTGDSSCPSSSGSVPFCPLRLNQRPGLALVNGVVYVSWASHGDVQPYHGWIIGFDASTLALTTIFNSSPNGREGGIWGAGGAPAVDSSNNLYVITGNGDFDGSNDFGDSLLKLSTTSGLSLLDSFTPHDQGTLDSQDQDFGSGAAIVLVDLPSGAAYQHLVIGGGKGAGYDGELYVLSRDGLGGYQQGIGGVDKVVQEFPINYPIFGTPAFWQNQMYLAGINSPLESFALSTTTSTFNTAPTSQSTAIFRGATPSISASGTTNGIVWAIDSRAYGTTNSGSRTAGPSVLRAYDASNLGAKLWDSTLVSTDAAGNAVKFSVPTVTNGKVYIGTRGNDDTQGGGTVLGQIDVYGLKP